MSAPIETISYREFARRDLCDESRVRRGVKNGELPQLPGKQLPADLVGTAWRAGNRLGAETAESPHERTADSAPAPTLAEAVRRREVALARLRHQEWQVRSAEWVLRADAASGYREAADHVRRVLWQLPGRLAPRVAVCKSFAEIQTTIRDAVHDVLTAASTPANDAPGRPHAPSTYIPGTATKTVAEAAKVDAIGLLYQLDVDIAAGVVIRAAAVAAAFGSRCSGVRQRLLEFQATLPPRLLGRDREAIEALIGKAVDEALEELPSELPAGAFLLS